MNYISTRKSLLQKGLFAIICNLLLLHTYTVAAQEQACWSGTWTGTWGWQSGPPCSLNESGAITLWLTVSNGSVSGSGIESGVLCYDINTCEITGSGSLSGTITGTVSGNTITLSGDWVDSCNDASYGVDIGGTLSGCTITGYPHLTVQREGGCDSCRITPTITWTNPSPITYGTPLDSTELNATSSVAGDFAYDPAAGTVLDAGTNTLSVVFTPADAFDYSSTTNTVDLIVLSNAVVGQVFCICDSNTIVGATVQIGNYSAQTDSNGAYTITNIPSGTYTGSVTANNYATFTTNVTVPPAVPVVTNNVYLTNLTLVINPVFDSTITGNVNAPTITNSIKAAIQVYKQTVANPMCVTILFSTTTNPRVLGVNNAALATIPYSQYLADLQANPNKSPNDSSALASLPAGPGTGINGNTQVTLTAANLAAIGETGTAAAAVASFGGGYYGKILMNVSSLSRLQATAAHEMNETLGTGGWGSSLYLAGSYSGQASPTTGIGPLDLFRYSSSGVRSFTLDPAATAYFSINGGSTKLVFFNQSGNGSDFADWGDGVSPADGLGNNPPQVQDATGSGNPSMGANEFIALDVVGYTLTAPPSTIQTASYSGRSFSLEWSALPGQSYQVQFTTNLNGTVWNNLGSPIIASNMSAVISDISATNTGRFYRVVNPSTPAVPALSSYKARTQAILTPYTIVTDTNITRQLLRNGVTE